MGQRARSERTLDAVEHSRTLMEWWPFLIFHRGGLRIKVINNSRREFEVLIMSVETDSRTVCGTVLKEVLGFRPLPVLPEQFPVRRFPIPCYFIRNSLLFRNRELPSNHLKYRRLPRQKTAGSAQKWPKFPVFPCYSWLPAETG